MLQSARAPPGSLPWDDPVSGDGESSGDSTGDVVHASRRDRERPERLCGAGASVSARHQARFVTLIPIR